MEKISVSHAKALKKMNERSSLFFNNAPHAPNKNESECLRRIMAETGLTDEEVRSHKIYRKQLAEASKAHGNKNEAQRYMLRLMKKITKQTKLPIDHPETKTLFISTWNEIKENVGGWARFNFYRRNAEEAYSSARYLSSKRFKKDLQNG